MRNESVPGRYVHYKDGGFRYERDAMNLGGGANFLSLR
jgi:hypothetical protein